MKSFAVESTVPSKEKGIKFPVIAKYKADSDFIVRFTGCMCGVILKTGRSCRSVGDKYSGTVPVSNKDVWEILPNDYQLILQNDQ